MTLTHCIACGKLADRSKCVDECVDDVVGPVCVMCAWDEDKQKTLPVELRMENIEKLMSVIRDCVADTAKRIPMPTCDSNGR